MNHLESLFNPKSIAVIGASNKDGKAGNHLIRNLQLGKFSAPIMPVNPKHTSVAGILAYKSIDALPVIPDVAVLCTKTDTHLELVSQLGQKGVKSVIIIASKGNSDSHQNYSQALIELTKQYDIRLIGPNSLGIILPWLNFNASLAPIPARKGNIAFICQSAALCNTVLDWADDRRIGFSAFISLGEGDDINFPELLDYFSRDGKTTAILLYIEHIKDARAFISAARAAARNRRVLVLKSGRTFDGAHALPHLRSVAYGLDAAYDAAIKRSGMLRVTTTQELFAAVETLSHTVKLRGERLVIVSNGGGPAVMAVDTLIEQGGQLAPLSEQTLSALNAILPEAWSQGNPIDIVGDADVNRYQAVLNILLNSGEADAILLMHSPSLNAPTLQTASQLATFIQAHPEQKKITLLANCQGEGRQATVARLAFARSGFPAYRTPESAVTAFMHLVEYKKNQKQLRETPESIGQIDHDLAVTKAFIQKAISNQTHMLTTHECRDFFQHYGIDVMPTWLAKDPIEAVTIASQVGYPLALKLHAKDIVHKSDVNGVVLDINNTEELANNAQAMLDRVAKHCPTATIEGLELQHMADRAGTQELRLCMQIDPVFGPVILLGEEGNSRDFERDAEVAIPPLNMTLARYFITDAIKKRKLHNSLHGNALNIEALCQCLVRFSQIIIDHPEIAALDIHPLLVKDDQITILDTRLTLNDSNRNDIQPLAIRPYPKELESQIQLKNGETLLLRPILPEDEPLHKAFISQVSVEDLYKRFFSDVGELNHEALANLTQIDYAREMAFVAVHKGKSAENYEIYGVVRALANPEGTEAEFAVLVRSDLKGQGLGNQLMEKIIDYCRASGLRTLTGMTMPSNTGMVALAKHKGFSIDVQLQDGVVDMALAL